MKMERSNFYIFTGGPGSGKTSIIEALSKLGFLTIGEAGRQIIQEQISIGGDALHWRDQIKFRDLMLSRSMDDFQKITENKLPVFFDRGIPELIGYSHMIKAPISSVLSNAVEHFRYNQKVFITPPWKEIYRNDNERKQTYEEAVTTYHAAAEAYTESGYQLIEVPKISISERVNFVLEEIASITA